MDSRYYRPEGVGVFPLNYTARERTVLEIQAKRDRRHIPPLWFWRLLTPDEGPNGADPDDDSFEQPLIHRQYAPPVAAHIYVDDSGESKGMKRGKVDTEGAIKVEVSRAEVIRLYGVYGILSDEYEVPSKNEDELIYIPQPGDLFFFKGTHLRIHQLADVDHFGPTGNPGKWEGTASQFVDDASAPLLASRADLIPPSNNPPQPVGMNEISWPG